MSSALFKGQLYSYLASSHHTGQCEYRIFPLWSVLLNSDALSPFPLYTSNVLSPFLEGSFHQLNTRLIPDHLQISKQDLSNVSPVQIRPPPPLSLLLEASFLSLTAHITICNCVCVQLKIMFLSRLYNGRGQRLSYFVYKCTYST